MRELYEHIQPREELPDIRASGSYLTQSHPRQHIVRGIHAEVLIPTPGEPSAKWRAASEGNAVSLSVAPGPGAQGSRGSEVPGERPCARSELLNKKSTPTALLISTQSRS